MLFLAGRLSAPISGVPALPRLVGPVWGDWLLVGDPGGCCGLAAVEAKCLATEPQPAWTLLKGS